MTSQASGMPPVIAYKLLRRTENFPSEISCFFVWARLVYFELADAGLISIIRTDLPKPQVNDPNYAQWSFLSLRVGKWLKNNVDQEVRDKLTLPSYADDVMKAIGVLSIQFEEAILTLRQITAREKSEVYLQGI